MREGWRSSRSAANCWLAAAVAGVSGRLLRRNWARGLPAVPSRGCWHLGMQHSTAEARLLKKIPLVPWHGPACLLHCVAKRALQTNCVVAR